MNKQVLRLPAKAMAASGGATSEGLQEETPISAEARVAAFNMAFAIRGGMNPLHAAVRHFPGDAAAYVRRVLRQCGNANERRAFDAAVLAISVDELAKIV